MPTNLHAKRFPAGDARMPRAKRMRAFYDELRGCLDDPDPLPTQDILLKRMAVLSLLHEDAEQAAAEGDGSVELAQHVAHINNTWIRLAKAAGIDRNKKEALENEAEIMDIESYFGNKLGEEKAYE